jgi:hypothetical protein
LSEKRGVPDAQALLHVAHILGDKLGDLPQAIARAREVPADVPETPAARHLEASYRARIGDRVGASQAFGRMREAIETGSARSAVNVSQLRDAAHFELAERDDATLAERHLALALRLAPHDPDTAVAYRRAAALLDERRRRG